MDSLTILLIALMLACCIWAVVAGMRILDYLKQHNVPVDFVVLRLKFFKYLSQYRDITLQETGQVGALHYHYIIPFFTALVIAAFLILKHFLG